MMTARGMGRCSFQLGLAPQRPEETGMLPKLWGNLFWKAPARCPWTVTLRRSPETLAPSVRSATPAECRLVKCSWP